MPINLGAHLIQNDIPPAVLIATLGSEAQVVTAALELLLTRGESIAHVAVLHTSSTAKAAGAGSVSEAVARLEAAFQDPAHTGSARLELLPLPGPDNRPLEDIDSPQAAQAAFRFLYRQVWQAKLRSQRIHLCPAGGRKILSLYAMLAAELLFDAPDKLWLLVSGGDFLASKRLWPTPHDDAHLVEIPIVEWSNVAPALLDISKIDDPFLALERQRHLRLEERLEIQRAFVHGALTPAERRVVVLLSHEGLGDAEIAERLSISPRTVEQHLRAAYHKAANHWNLAQVSRAQLVSLLGLYNAVR